MQKEFTFSIFEVVSLPGTYRGNREIIPQFVERLVDALIANSFAVVSRTHEAIVVDTSKNE